FVIAGPDRLDGEFGEEGGGRGRQDFRRRLADGSAEPAPAEPVGKVEEPGQLRLSIAELKAGKLLADDDFKHPDKSLFTATPAARSLKIMVRGDGQVEVGPSQTAEDFDVPAIDPVPTPDGFRQGDFNTLAVMRQGKEVTVFLNGKRLVKTFNVELGACVCGLE